MHFVIILLILIILMKSSALKVIITGATDGIGLVNAKKFAQTGHELILHGRNHDKLKNIQNEIIESINPKCKIYTYQADLSEIDQVHDLVSLINNDHDSLDILINNAGVYTEKFIKNSIEMEITFAVNVAAPFILFNGLLPLLKKSNKKSRILNVSSISQGGKININNLQLLENNAWSAHRSYSNSKLLIAALSKELSERISLDECIVMSCDPGTVNTKMLLSGWGPIGIDVNDALHEYELMTSYSDDELNQMHGNYYVSHRESRCCTDVYNKELREELWNQLMNLTRSK